MGCRSVREAKCGTTFKNCLFHAMNTMTWNVNGSLLDQTFGKFVQLTGRKTKIHKGGLGQLNMNNKSLYILTH